LGGRVGVGGRPNGELATAREREAVADPGSRMGERDVHGDGGRDAHRAIGRRSFPTALCFAAGLAGVLGPRRVAEGPLLLDLLVDPARWRTRAAVARRARRTGRRLARGVRRSGCLQAYSPAGGAPLLRPLIDAAEGD